MPSRAGGNETEDRKRLIEVAFPLKQASIDSVHEKNVRHGHISTLHIWPARRPLAACRAALIATLLPDPGDPEERRQILERLAGRVVQVPKRRRLPNGRIEETLVEETVGGILHWGRESGPDLDWFRERIREAYGGRGPRVLDPFAGGGAIPLEAMRLGCQATAIDINPVAWFILKCTLEYPQRLAGQRRPLPRFALESPEFMRDFLGGAGKRVNAKNKPGQGSEQQAMFEAPEADPFDRLRAGLAWHVRAWGWWVLQHAQADLERFYPRVDGKPTVAYLWARTVQCKNCRATVPLLKTRWLCKKERKRVLLTMTPRADGTGVEFGVATNVPIVASNPAQRREDDRRLGAGTMSRSGATCPLCGTIMAMEDIRLEGRAGRLGAVMTAVVVDGPKGKEYRLPADEERCLAEEVASEVDRVFAEIPFGLPNEPLPSKEALGFRVPLYGFDTWHKLFTPRQLVALGTFVKHTRAARGMMRAEGYPDIWVEAISASLGLVIGRAADSGSSLCHWQPGGEFNVNTFQRFALPINWDFAEINPLSKLTGSYLSALTWVSLATGHCTATHRSETSAPYVGLGSSLSLTLPGDFDAIVTDPPYYDAIPYSDLMDFFYVWLRKLVPGLSAEFEGAFRDNLGPKWDHAEQDGELIDDASRFLGDGKASRDAYERGMERSFHRLRDFLRPGGRFVVVFASKQPAAWESLVAAIVRAGFLVDASWPIQTERAVRTRSLASAALASSVWLVCKKRPETGRPGWDNQVLQEMRSNIHQRLRDFWDAGIRGPDFVWAATGPALEAYSKHPVVKKANQPGEVLTVSEFLREARRMVVDFVVGRVLSHNGDGDGAGELDDLTTYYLLHRHDFGLDNAPIGACILYAISCGLSDSALADQFDLLTRTGGQANGSADEADDTTGEEADADDEAGSGNTVRLKAWQARKRKTLGYEAPSGRSVPLIDQAHRLVHLWKAGDQIAVDDYLDARGLRRSAVFHRVLQALIELAPAGSEERALLENISNHLGARSQPRESLQPSLIGGDA